MKTHIEKYNILFDICSCKCRDYDMCRCIKEKRIPFAEIVFFIDLRTESRMHIKIDRTYLLHHKAELHQLESKFIYNMFVLQITLLYLELYTTLLKYFIHVLQSQFNLTIL